MKLTNYILLSAFLCIGFSYALLFFLSKEELIRFTSEDHLFENLTTIGLFLSGLVFLLLYLNYREVNDLGFLKTKRNIFFLLLALLFFFAAGEEISWGQRIFGIKTPDAFSSNVQHETNIHNLGFLMKEYYTEEGVKVKQKSWVSRFLNVGSFTNAFWVIWTIIIPILYKRGGKIREFLRRVNIPNGPLSIGGLFALNYVLLHAMRLALPFNNEHNEIKVVEIKESNMAFLFLALALAILGKKNRKSELA